MMRKERGALHIIGLIVVLVVLGAVFFTWGTIERVPEMERHILFLERKVEVMQKQLDDIDLRLKVAEIRPGA